MSVTETIKVCSACLEVKTGNHFGRDDSRPDGLAYICLECRRDRYVHYARQPSPRGRSYVEPRDGDKKQARRRVNHLVNMGILPAPGDVPCADCGHIGAGRRHEYDHHMGYAGLNHERVEAVCSSCHHERERRRDGR